MAFSPRKDQEGETRFGSERRGIQGTLYVQSGGGGAGAGGKGSVFVFDGVSASGARSQLFLFFDTTGNLRASKTYPANTETSGTIVSLAPAT